MSPLFSPRRFRRRDGLQGRSASELLLLPHLWEQSNCSLRLFSFGFGVIAEVINLDRPDELASLLGPKLVWSFCYDNDSFSQGNESTSVDYVFCQRRYRHREN